MIISRETSDLIIDLFVKCVNVTTISRQIANTTENEKNVGAKKCICCKYRDMTVRFIDLGHLCQCDKTDKKVDK